jgi:hypothetical protein
LISKSESSALVACQYLQQKAWNSYLYYHDGFLSQKCRRVFEGVTNEPAIRWNADHLVPSPFSGK